MVATGRDLTGAATDMAVTGDSWQLGVGIDVRKSVSNRHPKLVRLNLTDRI